ncbi:methyl-accepting chemotaxis protein [Lacimicrobium sp. SS2-24]|uniref:methyl-accepting chemotaxis protein n=1 Tax=Lacimicrobium sp. SS2-24 TaxID=2005569 RepID=UPI000B4B7D65|nr:methyl-accepting chemotaxis protein [Lacimicrobium sp. SS2-24]
MLRNLLICYDDNMNDYLKGCFEEDFKLADKIVLITLFAYFVIVAGLTSLHNGYYILGLVGGGLVFGICFAAYKTIPGTLMSRLIMAVGLTAMMAISIQQANGLGEGHFLFFLNFAILIRYRDILPLLMLIAVTVVHHLTMTYCQYVGAELWGQSIMIFSWGDQTELGLLAPLIYHVVIAVIGAIIATYYILEGNIRFLEASRVIGLVQEGAKGNLAERIKTDSPTAVVTAVNGFFDRLGKALQETSTTATALTEQASQSSSLAHASSEQANQQQQAISMVSSAVHEMTSATRDIAQNAETTAKALDDTVHISKDGQQLAKKFEDTSTRLARRVEEATEVLSKLEKNSQQINSIVSTIQGISEQTNLLALNAAIEAARAGEQGRGFAVVADEVRVLSQRTHDSTEEISDMITALQSNANSAVTMMSSCVDMTEESVNDAANASKSFTQIAEAIQDISDMAGQIATAAEQQTTVTEEINKNTVDIQSVSERFLEDAKQSLEKASELNTLSTDLSAQIQQFRLS